MHVDVNGTRLWFDVDGPALVPDGRQMRTRPTVVLVHGGPASHDHTYFKPHFAYLTTVGRSARHDPAHWRFESCADDLAAFCDALGIAGPVVLGHSMGGFVAMLYGIRHPGHAKALILQSTTARFDVRRLVEGVRRVAGDEVAELAGREYGGDPVTAEEWARVFAAFGPHIPTADELARRIRNPNLAGPTRSPCGADHGVRGERVAGYLRPFEKSVSLTGRPARSNVRHMPTCRPRSNSPVRMTLPSLRKNSHAPCISPSRVKPRDWIAPVP
jgi:proline iminopeptidase